MRNRFQYITIDVFTNRAFAGNPVAVIPDAQGLTTEQMQHVAAEFNYSESTFVLPPDDVAHTARVRIFTPKTEVPFAGHPNVGTAFALAFVGERSGKPLGQTLVFEEGAGLVPVELTRDDNGSVRGAILTAPQPLSLGQQIPSATVAECVGLEPTAIITSRHEPVIASVGLPFVIAEVAVDAIGHAKPNVSAFAEASARFPCPSGRFSVHLYAQTAGRVQEADLRARMFAPLSGVFEDPATGSANAALVALLASIEPNSDAALRFEILQGLELGRPSRLIVSAQKRGGSIVRVHVGGSCVAMMEGEFTI